MQLDCTVQKINNLMIESIKIGVNVANYLFLTFLHGKSKEKNGNSIMKRFNFFLFEKLPNN